MLPRLPPILTVRSIRGTIYVFGLRGNFKSIVLVVISRDGNLFFVPVVAIVFLVRFIIGVCTRLYRVAVFRQFNFVVWDAGTKISA